MLLSQHEGFCVPLVEAMAMNLPIVARASSAIPETLNGAGLIWDSADPVVFAAAADRIFRDDKLRQHLEDLGNQRYRERYTPKLQRARFAELLEHLE